VRKFVIFRAVGWAAIKCELALVQRDRKFPARLKLYGQELTGSSYAIARMNMVIHDMDGEIVRGNSMSNPKFRDTIQPQRFDMRCRTYVESAVR